MTTLPVETRRHMLRRMLEIRTCEERIQELFLENVIRGTTHLCIGQEAVSVGMAAVIDAPRGDTVTCTYRGHGHALALGLSLRSLMAEMMGKEAGCCKGKGGSMHLTDMSIGLIGTFAIVGAGLPVTNGAARSAHIKGAGAGRRAEIGAGTPPNGPGAPDRADQGDGRGQRLDLRRRHAQHRRVARGRQPGGGLEAARRFPLREQPLRRIQPL